MSTAALTNEPTATVTSPKVTRETRFEDLPELLTPKEAAALLKMSAWTVYQSIDKKLIPSVKVGEKRLYVPRTYFLGLLTKV